MNRKKKTGEISASIAVVNGAEVEYLSLAGKLVPMALPKSKLNVDVNKLRITIIDNAKKKISTMKIKEIKTNNDEIEIIGKVLHIG